MSNALAGVRAHRDWGKLQDFEDRFFTTRKMRKYGLALLAAHVIALAGIFFNGHWLFRPDGKLNCIDFGFLWLSGKFAASADPGRVYDLATFGAAQTNFFGAGNCILIHHFEYPPVLLFFTWPVGMLPYFAGFAVWNIALLLLYLGVVYGVLPRANAIIGALTPMAAARDLQLGHNGFLTAGLVGLPLVLLERKPFLAGILLGLLSYKPQFGVLFPVALMASRNWRALTGATLSILALAIAAAFAFGVETWLSFFSALNRSSPSLSPETSVGLQLQSIYGLLQWAGLNVRAAWTLHAAIALVMAAAVWMVWARPVPHALKSAMLCAGCLVVNPYLLQYDFCVLTVAVAFLIGDGFSRGFLPGERSIITLGWVGLVWLDILRGGTMIFCAILLWVIYRRVVILKLDYAPAGEPVPARAAIRQRPN